MSEKPNSAAIGAFIMGAVIIAITAVLFINGSGWGQDKFKVVMIFDGSVKGLSVGAPVALKGVQIGQVTGIDLILDTNTIDVIMEVEAEILGDHMQRRGDSDGDFTEELIARGLRAQLNTQSLLTGLLYIQLDFHTETDIILAETDSLYAQIPTIPTELQRLSREISTIDFSVVAENIQTMADGLSAFIASGAFQQLPQDLQATLASVRQLSNAMKLQLESSGPRLDALLEGATETVNTVNLEIPKLSASAAGSLAELDGALANFNDTLNEVELMLSEDSPTRYQLNQALHELAQAGRAMQLLAKTLEEQPEALIRGRSEDKP